MLPVLPLPALLSLLWRARPELRKRLRVIETWGPYPIQPVVLRSELFEDVGAKVTRTLLGLHADRSARAELFPFGLVRCVPIDEALYEDERRALEALGQLDRAS